MGCAQGFGVDADDHETPVGSGWLGMVLLRERTNHVQQSVGVADDFVVLSPQCFGCLLQRGDDSRTFFGGQSGVKNDRAVGIGVPAGSSPQFLLEPVGVVAPEPANGPFELGSRAIPSQVEQGGFIDALVNPSHFAHLGIRQFAGGKGCTDQR